ncbi:mammalian cell entry protein [Mycolicibacterium sp. CH28]|uniref:mammalian cell entry protein n=1 Tax=Mycolicibacterium sp. CH28 TaxID=2512237 RepID=UPI001081D489|nr:mammalian cell entry protein [Mycolicibacterium sp. CH28]TGD87915.1 mammalian cell entry protein [Mycolicibacterium sp. CH28]
MTVTFLAVGALTGWLGYRALQIHEEQAHQRLFVDTARRAALNLTTIGYADAQADVQRIIDSSTGRFRDDFQKRVKPFIDAVKQSRSTSVGTVTEAGLESATDGHAQVLVAVSIDITNGGGGHQDPRTWRMRLGIEQTETGPKVSDVAFVP